MKIERLLQFARLASYRSLNQASQDLFISHQGLSKLIQSLEKEFAASLVIRQSDGIVLTRDGQYLCQKAAEMAQVLGTLENKLYHNSCQRLAGEVTVFLDELTYAKFFTKLLPYLQTRCPELVLQVMVVDNLQYTADDYEIFLQLAKNYANSIGLFSFFVLSHQPNIAYPKLTIYPFKNSELLLGCNPKGLTVHAPFAEYNPQPILILNERDFGQNNALTQHLAQKFELITVKSQLQCVRALSTSNSYTVELADDIVSFPPFIQFASCTPPIIFQTYYMFFGHDAGWAQSLYSVLLNALNEL